MTWVPSVVWVWGLVGEGAADLEVDAHEFGAACEFVVLDELQTQGGLRRADLEIWRDGLKPGKDVLCGLRDFFFEFLLVGLVFRRPSHLGDGAACRNRADHDSVDGHVVDFGLGTVFYQFINHGRDKPIVFEPYSKCRGCSRADATCDEQGLKLDGFVLRVVQVFSGVGPGSRTGVVVRSVVVDGGRDQKILGVFREKSDDEGIHRGFDGPFTPGFEGTLYLVDHAPVGQGFVDGEGKGTFIGQVPGGDDGDDVQGTAVDGPELEAFEHRVLHLLLRFIELVADEDHGLFQGSLQGKHLRGGILRLLGGVVDHRESDEIRGFQGREIQVGGVESAGFRGLKSLFGFADPGVPEDDEVSAGLDGEPHEGSEGGLIDGRNSCQHFFT